MFWGPVSWYYIFFWYPPEISITVLEMYRAPINIYCFKLKYLGAQLNWMAGKFGGVLFFLTNRSFISQTATKVSLCRELYFHHQVCIKCPSFSSHIIMRLCLLHCILISTRLVSLPYWLVSFIKAKTVMYHFGIPTVQNIVGT